MRKTNSFIKALRIDKHIDLGYIYKAIDELQQLCRSKRNDEVDKHINVDIIADIKDTLRKG